jgi:hypothetical protein
MTGILSRLKRAMKNFDDIFSRKVKEAFDNYNADHLAEEGWNAFVREQEKRRRRAIMIPLWARAASIAVLVTLGILFTVQTDNRRTGEPAAMVARETAPGGLTETGVEMEDANAVSPLVVDPGKASGTAESEAVQVREAGREKSGLRNNRPAGPVLTKATRAETIVDERSPQPMTANTELLPPEVPVNAAVTSVTNLNISDNIAELRLTDDADSELRLRPKKMLRDTYAFPREKKTTTIMTGLTGMMASIGNMTSAAQGVSLGVYVEQQLTRRISVRPGLAMAKHNYTMENATGGRQDFLDYTTPELNGMTGTTTSYEADMDILSMEIPVNFVFSLLERGGSNLFVTTGVSTVIYLDQRLSGNFNNTYTKTNIDAISGEVSYESMTTSVRVYSEEEVFDRVDFLGLANFSAGYSLPFSKTSHLLFEPFVQLPIKDLTSLNLRIRYGGLSMKIKF